MKIVASEGENPVRIKLGSTKRFENVDAFLDEYFKETSPNPFNDRQRVFNGAIIELYPVRSTQYKEGEIHLSDIRSVSPKQGYGKEAMTFLVDLADRHGVFLTLEADAYLKGEKGTMTTSQLITWYKKFGFKNVTKTEMTRKPKG